MSALHQHNKSINPCAYLSYTVRVTLNQHTETSEGRILLIIVLDLPKSGAPVHNP